MFRGTLTVLGMLAAGCLAHIYPSSPCMRGSPLAECNYEPKDYSLSSPIGSGGSTAAPLCHHDKAFDKPVKSYKAGDSINVVFSGGATHNGGHCEFSLSYDGGKTFVAIKTILDTCFLEGMTFNVPIPSNAPSGDKVVFAWSWVNKTGNREFYMTCSDIAIQGSGSGVLEGPPMIHPNYGNGPKIGEFTNGGDNGSQYYKERQNIRVQGSGSSSGATGGSSGGSSSDSSQGTGAASSAGTSGTNQSSSGGYDASGSTSTGAGATGQTGTDASAAGTAGTTPSTSAGQGTSAGSTDSTTASTAGGSSSSSTGGATAGQGTAANSASSTTLTTTGQGAAGSSSAGSLGSGYSSASSDTTTGSESTAGQANGSTGSYSQTANPPATGADATAETATAAPPAAREDSVPVASSGSSNACASGQGNSTDSHAAANANSGAAGTNVASSSGTMDENDTAVDTPSADSVYKAAQPLPSSEAANSSEASSSAATSGSGGATGSSAYSCQSSGSSNAIQVRAGDMLVTMQCPQGLVCKTSEGSGPYCDRP